MHYPHPQREEEMKEWYQKKFPFGFWTYVFSRVQRWQLKRKGYVISTHTVSTNQDKAQ